MALLRQLSLRARSLASVSHGASLALALSLGVAVSLGAAIFLGAAPALAQASVAVQVRTADGSPGEARVTLTPEGGGAAQSCQTQGGRCQIAGVVSGRYVVTAAPLAAGRAPIPRPVLIPPSGQVTVSVTLR